MDAPAEKAVVDLLTKQKQTLAVAESCTGGRIADRLTEVPGASVVFRGGVVAYQDEVKERFLGVRAATLKSHGAVSEAVAREMAEGARRVFETDYAIATTGFAGPDGGPEAPVGTAFVAIAFAGGTNVAKEFNPTGRTAFKEQTARQALERLAAHLKNPSLPS